MKKIATVLLCALCLLAGALPLSACKGPGAEKKDSNRTQLYVSYFNGGFGDEWIKALKARFEDAHKDEVYEQGKKGVQVMLAGSKDGVKDLVDKYMLGSNVENEVFFSERAYYCDVVKMGALLDISDIMDVNLPGETKTIEGKLNGQQTDFYNVDGKYYGLPHYAAYPGIFYDVELFEKFNLYFKDTAGGAPAFITSSGDTKSKGRDGLPNTDDDGLPATFDEFFMLMNQMKIQYGITPLVWSGAGYSEYLESVMFGMAADYEGTEQFKLNYNFKGTAKTLLNLPVPSNGAYTERGDEPISRENAYLLKSSAGRYHTLDFFNRIIKNSDYYGDLVFSPSHSHLDAQKDFLESEVMTGTPIAMIMEGTWWENEAENTFRIMADRFGQEYSRDNRKFGMMPFPVPTSADIGKPSVLVDICDSLAWIKSGIAEFKIPLAKSFLQFAYTDISINEFCSLTSTPMALTYTLLPEDKAKMSYLGQAMDNKVQSSDIIYAYSSDPLFTGYSSDFYRINQFGSIVNGVKQMRPIVALRNKNVSAADYFNGMVNFYQSDWNSNYGSAFNL